MDKLKMHSPNLTQENIASIRDLFPNCVTESRDAQGKLKLAVDFDQLRQELSESIVEGPQERYHLNWPGKREALLAANAPIAKTLRPCREESVDFDTTKNLFIEGDNLDALKLLQETYLGKVKMIYIDPPYNTGNDFIYEDDFAQSAEEFLKRSNQKNEEGSRLVANSDANGRFHSDWLSMIYPRLKLARNLLSEDGAIFISIDDSEVDNLKKACAEIFGDSNFVATIIWQKVFSPKNSARHFSEDHDYILVIAKNKDIWKPRLLPRTAEQDKLYSNPDKDPRGPWTSGDLTARNFYADGLYEVTGPTGKTFGPGKGRYWRSSYENFKKLDEDNRIWWGADKSNMPRLKRFLSEVSEGRVPQTLWTYKEVGHTQDAKKELLRYVEFHETANVLNSVKPTKLLMRLIHIGTQPKNNEIVMDFFAGSGPTAHATLQQNQADGGNRRFILVQLPEKLPAQEDSVKTIADFAKSRIRNVGKEIREKKPLLDIGFRTLKIDSSNMAEIYYSPDKLDQKNLGLFTENIKSDRTPEDLLLQVLLDWGVDLTLPIYKKSIRGKTVFLVDENALAACFDTGIDEALIKELAEFKPLRAVFRDNGFASDDIKINAEQIFKQLSPGTDMKAI
jgi:adenine-specific DNA-methyltransferase